MTAGSQCGARRKTGALCQHPAGWGTDHPGAGRCKFHGGSSRNGRKAGHREAALKFARGALGAEVGVTPLDALEQSVRLMAGVVDYWRHQLADAAANGEADRVRELAPQYLEAVKTQKDVAKAATDAGVAERRQLLAERTAAMLGAAFDDALAAVAGDLLTEAVRAAVVAKFSEALSVLDSTAEDFGDPLALVVVSGQG